MSNTKSFFRYLRGELLNGFYIRKLNLLANALDSMELLKTEILYWMSFKLEVSSEITSIRHKDLKGIGQVAGVLSYLGLSSYLNGWFRLSESFVVGDRNRSERGLLLQETGELEYQRLDHDEYSSDISTIATGTLPNAKRMSLIPDDAVPIGYVYGDEEPVLLDNGMIDDGYLMPTPPEGYVLDPVTHKWVWTLAPAPALIYTPWYGDKYLPLATLFPINVILPDNLTLFLLTQHQKIKYNGLGIIYLFEITQTMVSDLIENLKIELLAASSVYYYKMTFTKLEDNFNINDGWGRFSAWLYLIQSKYPLIQFNETGD